ncbi:hypothetical protein GCM10009560_03240 [Nonomuraea longicatena]|uniref:Regulatory protein n=2 Tax=Nonomuraea longicatena TaxID=83682 RepID=A0ABN1NNL6_9ACTN
MCDGHFSDWLGHLCGLCLALRDEHGQAARLVTNYDALLVSVLAEAQVPAAAPRRTAGPCPLRGFRGAEVVRSDGARLAASVSLILAATKLRDHVSDGDGLYARRAVAAGAARTAARWTRAGTSTARDLAFDPAPLVAAAERQTGLERRGEAGLLELTAPAEDAVAAAFAHTARLSGCPGNAEPLERAGRAFGRLAHLLDAVEDLGADRAVGAYNPLEATGTGLAEARGHCDAAHTDLRAAFDTLELRRSGLARTLLVTETARAITRAFATPDETRPPPPGLPKQVVGGLATAFSCGLYRPPWDPKHRRSFCKRHDCGNCRCDADCGRCDNCCCDCGG